MVRKDILTDDIETEAYLKIYGEEIFVENIIPTEYKNIITNDLIIQFYHFYNDRYRLDIIQQIKG